MREEQYRGNQAGHFGEIFSTAQTCFPFPVVGRTSSSEFGAQKIDASVDTKSAFQLQVPFYSCTIPFTTENFCSAEH